MYIAISGMMGSGKTTLAKKISSKLNWTYVPESLGAKKYLKDLFSEIQRWALEAQFGFLVDKATIALLQLERNKNFVLDRTFFEDIEIFAKYFHDKEYIDSRGFSTYKSLSEHYLHIIPPPEIIIYCECSLRTVKERIKIRDRDFQKLYPPKHVEEIFEIYDDWKNNIEGKPFYIINSEQNDFRIESIANMVVEDIINVVNSNTSQFELFEEISNPKLNILSEYIPYNSYDSANLTIKKVVPSILTPQHPYAYIAAPFTSIAQMPDQNSNNLELFDFPLNHGIIPNDDTMRQLLLNISAVLRENEILSIIPHRDVNDWGKKQKSPTEVLEKCIYHIEHCDLFIGILGESMGSHLEYGLALGLNKPSIIIQCEEIQSSFLSKGITKRMPGTITLQCESIKEIPNKLSLLNFSEIYKFF